MGRLSQNVKSLSTLIGEYEAFLPVLAGKIAELQNEKATCKAAADAVKKKFYEQNLTVKQGTTQLEQFQTIMAKLIKNEVQTVNSLEADLAHLNFKAARMQDDMRKLAGDIMTLIMAKHTGLKDEADAYKTKLRKANASYVAELDAAMEKAKVMYIAKKAEEQGIKRKDVRTTMQEDNAVKDGVKKNHKKSAHLLAKLQQIELDHENYLKRWRFAHPRMTKYMKVAEAAAKYLDKKL